MVVDYLCRILLVILDEEAFACYVQTGEMIMLYLLVLNVCGG
jgi:hypothetical protein